jgi:hypothetical protein
VDGEEEEGCLSDGMKEEGEGDEDKDQMSKGTNVSG